ncbi:MAG: DUF5666 domain-containing protein [Anaerolineae bacterium]|nr:DUF5666 domain-containing protein [Anaerolineae bacterium]
MNRTVKIILGIILLLAVAAGSFYGGTVYGKNQAQASFAAARQRGSLPFNPQGTPFPGMGQRNAQQPGMLFGQIAEIGDGTIVVTDANGKQVQVKVTDTTLIEKQASVSLSDLTAGETVLISGRQEADGSITARSIQAGAAGRFGFGGMGAPGATPAP